MNWLKHHPAQFSLIVASLGLCASTVTLITKLASLPHADAPAPPPAPRLLALAPPSLGVNLAEPSTPSPKWEAHPNHALFVSREYTKNGTHLELPEDAMFHPPVPNRWLIAHGLDYHDPKILEEDQDGDGFSNLIEFLGTDMQPHFGPGGKPLLGPDQKPRPDDSTDPRNPNSHPPYYTQLSVERIIRTPLELRFTTQQENTADPAHALVSINTSLQGGKSFFGKVGDTISGTPYRVESLAPKFAPGPEGTQRDVSELTLVHEVTGQKLVLPRNATVDAAQFSVILRYHWAPPGGQTVPLMTKNPGDTFSLPPETGRAYRVGEIDAHTVKVQAPEQNAITLHLAP